jgi:hypothetical protein
MLVTWTGDEWTAECVGCDIKIADPGGDTGE